MFDAMLYFLGRGETSNGWKRSLVGKLIWVRDRSIFLIFNIPYPLEL